jgi:hypothetical protein
MEAGQFSAAIAAVKLRAQLAGLYVQRNEDVTRPRDRAEIDAEILELLESEEASVPPRRH